MTLKEISHNILNLMRGGRSSNDELISIAQIEFNVLHYRAMLIRRDYARNGIVTRHLEQDLGCLELEPISLNTCCSLYEEPGLKASECRVKKTIRKIPRTVRFNFEEAITYVGTIDKLTQIQLLPASTIKFTKYSKFTGKNQKAFILDDYVYVTNTQGLDFINIRGIFENPMDLTTYVNCMHPRAYFGSGIGTGQGGSGLTDGPNELDPWEGTGVKPWQVNEAAWDETRPFPMPMDMIQAITQGLASGEMQMLMGGVNDTTNDRNQDSGGRMPAAPDAQQQQQE